MKIFEGFPILSSILWVVSGALVLRRLCLMRGMDFEEASGLLERAPEDQELLMAGETLGNLWGN